MCYKEFTTAVAANQVTVSLITTLLLHVHVDLQHHNVQHRIECPNCLSYFTTETAMNWVRPFPVFYFSPECFGWTYERFLSTAKRIIGSVVPIAPTPS